jgi:hypothetical protein
MLPDEHKLLLFDDRRDKRFRSAVRIVEFRFIHQGKKLPKRWGKADEKSIEMLVIAWNLNQALVVI